MRKFIAREYNILNSIFQRSEPVWCNTGVVQKLGKGPEQKVERGARAMKKALSVGGRGFYCNTDYMLCKISEMALHGP